MPDPTPEGLPRYPFQASPEALLVDIEAFIDVTIDSLSSFYMELPKGENFLEFPEFQKAYRELLATTSAFQKLDRAAVRKAVVQNGLVLVVLRSIVGLSPPELADLASETQGVSVDQGFARSIDGKARKGGALLGPRVKAGTIVRVNALIDAACFAIESGPLRSSDMVIHRLNKVDTALGLPSVAKAARDGVEYSAVLYERMLGRPFATHRDSVSELVGHLVEDAAAKELENALIPFHKTGQAERIVGFDQAPDFLIPTREDPKVVIEAKLTQDDGTARDKVTRVQHLGHLSEGGKRFEVIACIDGRGFRVRREDMRKLLLATQGKVFTVETMRFLVDHTGLNQFRPVK